MNAHNHIQLQSIIPLYIMHSCVHCTLITAIQHLLQKIIYDENNMEQASSALNFMLILHCNRSIGGKLLTVVSL